MASDTKPSNLVSKFELGGEGGVSGGVEAMLDPPFFKVRGEGP